MEDFNKGFIHIPHHIYNVLPLINLSLRERRAIDLIIRLTYGCHLEWVKLKQADFSTVKIGPTHAKNVINRLIEKEIIIKNKNNSSYKLNENFIATKLTQLVTNDLDRLRKLVGMQLKKRYSQIGNSETTDLITQNLPYKEEQNYQNSNTNSLPNVEVSASDSVGLLEIKDILNINKYTSDKDIEIADNNFSFKDINPDTFTPETNGEYEAHECWKRLEPHNKKSFLTTYLSAYRQGLPLNLFGQYASEIEQDPSIQNRGAVFNAKVREYFDRKAL